MKSISALGGKDRILRLRRVYVRTKASVEDKSLLLEDWWDRPHRHKQLVKWLEGNENATLIRIVNGDEGWEKVNLAETRSLTMEELAPTAESMISNVARELLPLINNPDARLLILPEALVDKRRMYVIRVIMPRQPQFELFFDSSTYLLAKSSYISRSKKLDGRTVEQYYGEYKEFAGTKYATKRIIKIDRETLAEDHVVELQPLTMFAPETFSKPR